MVQVNTKITLPTAMLLLIVLGSSEQTNLSMSLPGGGPHQLAAVIQATQRILALDRLTGQVPPSEQSVRPPHLQGETGQSPRL